MKKKYLLIILTCSIQLNAQDFAFKVNPVSLFFSGAEISFESKSSSDAKISVELVGGFLNYNINDTKDKLNVWGAELRYKCLLASKINGIEGTYIAPVGTLISGKINTNDITIYGLGAMTGYQFVFQNKKQKGFVLDLNDGFAHNWVFANQLNIDQIKGFRPRLGVSVGYAF